MDSSRVLAILISNRTGGGRGARSCTADSAERWLARFHKANRWKKNRLLWAIPEAAPKKCRYVGASIRFRSGWLSVWAELMNWRKC